MKFPAANVSIKTWDKDEDYLIYILDDKFIYTTDIKLYSDFFQDNLFVDSNGDVYKLVDRKLPSLTRRFLSFIPNFCKVELIFKRTTDKMTIEEVREHILHQINMLDDNTSKTEWINSVRNANTFEKIIFS